MMRRALTIAGSDSGGGAGIQADLKTFTVLGVYGMSAVTAVTVQNTRSVDGVKALSASLVYDQIVSVMDDIGADIIKIGMLPNEAVIEAVVQALDRYPNVRTVIDPVMQAKGGAALLQAGAETLYRQRLVPRAYILTPNLPEATALVGFYVQTTNDMVRAAEILEDMGVSYVVVKGGHLPGSVVKDLVRHEKQNTWYEALRINTPHTHGTGCTLSSAIAAYCALGYEPREAIERARDYVRGAILNAPGFGHGHGPLNHLWLLQNGEGRMKYEG